MHSKWVPIEASRSCALWIWEIWESWGEQIRVRQKSFKRQVSPACLGITPFHSARSEIINMLELDL
jgi:hypothetical protein